MKLYLAGPIFGCSVKECKRWRSYLTEQLSKINIKTKDPTRNILNLQRQLEQGIIDDIEDIVEQDKADINICDGIIAYMPFVSIGTCMEIMYAYINNKEIYIIAGQQIAESPWIIYHATEIFSEFYELVDWLGVRRC